MNNFVYKFSVIFFLLSGFIFSEIKAQTGQPVTQTITQDSLPLTQIIQSVVQNHPSVKEAQEAINIAESRIAIAKSGYLPNIDATGSFTTVGPVPSIPFPGLGTFQLFPRNNINAAVNYNQVIYDFGKTGKNVDFQKQNMALSQNNVDLTKQRLVLLAINSYYSLLYTQEALKIKDRELQTLNEHLNSVQKRLSSGSATNFEVLSTQVRISNTESQKLDLENMRKTQITILTSLSGLSVRNVGKDLSAKGDNSLTADTAAISYALDHRLEMVNSRQMETIAGLQYKLTKSQNNPSVSIFASGGGKNGYVPELNKVKLNYSAGVALRIPLFDGNRMKYNLVQSKSALNNSMYESELTKRNITDDVIESQSNCYTAKQKISRNQLQLQQAEQAFSLAQVNFNAGTITNLDLLDSETAVSETRLMLLKSEIDYLVSLYKLKQALGDKLY